MKYALVSISRIEKRTLQTDELWYDFLDTLKTTYDSTEATPFLAENLLLLPLNEKLLVFAEVVRTCKKAGYQSNVLFLEEKPKWITS